MSFDVFYFGCQKPNLFPFEAYAATIEEARSKSRTKYFWYIDGRFDYTHFDFSWFPQWSEVEQTHIHLLYSQYEEFQAVFMPRDTSLTLIENYHNQPLRKYVPRVASRKNWTIPEEVIDASTIDFTWAPPHYDTTPYIYHFGSEYQQSIGLIYTVPGATDTKFIGLPPRVDNNKEGELVKEADIIFVDMNNAESESQYEKIKDRYPNTQSLRFMNNWVDTIKRCLAKVSTLRFWVISSENDYSDFDFSWHPSAWQTYMLHVFPTGDDQKFGDTFYVHAPSFKSQANNNNNDLSTWYNVNYCADQAKSVKQLPHQIVTYTSDSVVDAIKAHRFAGTYAWFIKHASVTTTDIPPSFTTSSWSKKYRPVHVFSKSGSVLAVPRDSQISVNTQVYDYEYIVQSHTIADKDLDIAYISNGEPEAERWYDWLMSLGLPNRIYRVQNVKGRTQSFYAAANGSNTPWYFAVWAKLEANPSFDWTWQPDYMQCPKHYIFNATNPVNGLVYGHMAMVAYNKRLVLETTEPGLDFTLSKEHEVVELDSGIAHYNTSPIMTWRTAFREAIKLMNTTTDATAAARLSVWCNVGNGLNAEWSLTGANDAVSYYKSVAGDHDKLMLSFEWAWLDEYFKLKYSLTST